MASARFLPAVEYLDGQRSRVRDACNSPRGGGLDLVRLGRRQQAGDDAPRPGRGGPAPERRGPRGARGPGGSRWPLWMRSATAAPAVRAVPSSRPGARRPGRSAADRLVPGRRPGPRAGSWRPSPRRGSGRRSCRARSTSSGDTVASPDDRGALREQVGAALGGRDLVAQGDEGRSRLGQPAEDRRRHPWVARILGGDPPEGLQGRPVLARVARASAAWSRTRIAGSLGEADQVDAESGHEAARLDSAVHARAHARAGPGFVARRTDPRSMHAYRRRRARPGPRGHGAGARGFGDSSHERQ